MLDALEISKEIARLEYEESSYPNYAKLANLYTIQDRMGHKAEPPVERRYSAAPPAAETINEYGDSVFLRSIAGKDPAQIWPIIDDLMGTLSLVNKRAYDTVLRQIDAI